MKKQSVIVLIATRSTLLRDGLVALLTAIPQIDEVEIAGSLEAALLRVKAGKPQIVLVDLMLLGSTSETALEEIHVLSPGTQRMILTRDNEEIKWASERAEAFLTIGSLPSTIADVITKLLKSEREADDKSA